MVAPRVRDALVLVQGLARLLDDEPLRRKVAAGGAALMAGRSWKEIAATHRAVYSEVLRDQECMPDQERIPRRDHAGRVGRAAVSPGVRRGSSSSTSSAGSVTSSWSFP